MRRLFGLAVVATLAGAACASGGATSGGAGPVRIVVEGPMSGDRASNGVDMWRAAMLMADSVNAAGGVLGRQVRLVQGDDAADPVKGVALAREAAGTGVFALIGPYNSSVGIRNLPLWISAGVVPIHLTSNSATNGMGYTVQPKDFQIAPVEAKAVIEFFKARRVAIVFDESAYTAGIASDVKARLEKGGVEVVLYERFTEGKEDPKKIVDAIGASKADLFYTSTYFPQGASIAKEAAGRLKATCFMGLANQDPGFVARAGTEASRQCSFSGVPSADQFPAARGYVEEYRRKFQTTPGTWGTFTQDSLALLFDAVRRAGTWNREAVTRELSATRHFTGLTGTIEIDPRTGNRVDVPIVVLNVSPQGDFIIDSAWAQFAGFAIAR